MNHDIIIYSTDDGNASASLMTKDDNVWMNQNQLVELFDSPKSNINLHIKSILEHSELDQNS